MTQRVKRSIVAVLVGCLHISLQAASGVWTGSDDGVWSDTSNWQSGVVPADSSSYADLVAQDNYVTISNDLANLQLYMIRQLGGNYTVVGNMLTTAGNATTPGYGIYADAGTLTFLNPLKIARATRLWTLEGATVVTKGPITYNGSQYLVKYGAGEWIVEGAITGNEGVTDYLGVTEGILRLPVLM